MLLDLPPDVIRSVACFRLCAYTLRVETVTWTHNTSPTCDLCNAHDVQVEQHVLFHCTHTHAVSLRRTCALSIEQTYLSKCGVWTGCGQRQCTPSRQQSACNETEEPLIPISFPTRSLSRFSLLICKVSAACSCFRRHSHWTVDWTGLGWALPRL